ncbi:MAG: UDP-glucose/GDP-mannose dehydrogenase family protein [Candidatus Latescibacteria bacterium]|nr:UDP-glucose/GDP-mannose dehydrogenase family protein [Candidatus Latescibacterota bacterium]
MRRICVAGTGYVGLVTGACLADFGNVVICVDVDADKITELRKGQLPIYEPGLSDLVRHNVDRGRLSFSTEIPFAIQSSEIIFIAVGTPALPDGGVDLSYVMRVAETIADYMEDYKVIVNKSTVSVGTGAEIERIIRSRQKESVAFDVVSNPEFLREGSAIEDFMRPNRVVIGARTQQAFDMMADVYRALYMIETPVILTDIETAEMTKYASNAFLATKISFINEIAHICEHCGADVQMVARGMGLDARIGPKFLRAGGGYGGSCFPKDVSGLIHMAKDAGIEATILRAVVDTNERQKRLMLEKLEDLMGDFEGKSVGILGLSFKPDTDDIRESPSLTIIRGVLEAGGRVKAFDPAATEPTRNLFPDIEYCDDSYSTLRNADAAVLMTEWNEFRNLDLPRIKKEMNTPNFLDCRNMYDPGEMEALGFRYMGVGRGRRKSNEQ